VAEERNTENRVLLVEVQACVCVLSLSCVIETFRPVPIEPISGAPSYLRGISIIRGTPTPVVDLGDLLGNHGGVSGRFVILRVGDRQVALSVGKVLGVRAMDALAVQKLPPLLQGASKDTIEAVGTLDSQFLVVLHNGWRLPDEMWRSPEAREKDQ